MFLYNALDPNAELVELLPLPLPTVIELTVISCVTANVPAIVALEVTAKPVPVALLSVNVSPIFAVLFMDKSPGI